MQPSALEFGYPRIRYLDQSTAPGHMPQQLLHHLVTVINVKRTSPIHPPTILLVLPHQDRTREAGARVHVPSDQGAVGTWPGAEKGKEAAVRMMVRISSGLSQVLLHVCMQRTLYLS